MSFFVEKPGPIKVKQPICYDPSVLGVASKNIDPNWLVEATEQHELKDTLPKSLLNAALNEFTVWVDPLDATKEYSEGFLDHVTVLVGIALGKKAVAGVIHQPFYG